jgi:hypothetical protein
METLQFRLLSPGVYSAHLNEICLAGQREGYTYRESEREGNRITEYTEDLGPG